MNVTLKNVGAARNLYEKLPKWGSANNVLTSFFLENPLNKDKSIVAAKVCLIDGLYKTNLKDQIGLANHILDIKNLNLLLKRGDLNAASKIAKFGKINLISFASKYCHFHNKSAYPIYDKYVIIALKKLSNFKDTRDYIEFSKAVALFRETNELKEISYEDLDKYLWLAGFAIQLKKGKTNMNKEIISIYTHDKHQFDNILP